MSLVCQKCQEELRKIDGLMETVREQIHCSNVATARHVEALAQCVQQLARMLARASREEIRKVQEE